jgi:peptide/nickel transport system ATP-binding protein
MALLEVRDLAVLFNAPRSGVRRRRSSVHAVESVNLDVHQGQTLGLVGESGSGKSTTARAIVGLTRAAGGRILYQGEDLRQIKGAALASKRRQMNMVFQDPYSSLDPSMSVGDIVGEPIDARRVASGQARSKMIDTALADVGLRPELRGRFPSEFSGGQRQRIAIARAIVLRPAFIVLDEAVSALDVSTKNQVLLLLERIQRDYETAFLFISHDLAVVRQASTRVAVMYAGRIVEEGPSGRVCNAPAHPYTVGLTSAIPIPNPRLERARHRVLLQGSPPSPLEPQPGCPFQPRCEFAMDICRSVMPPAFAVATGGSVACHLYGENAGVAMRDLFRQRTGAGIAPT